MNTPLEQPQNSQSVLTFDGIDDYIELPAANIDYSQGFTVEAWVRYNSFRHWSRIIDLGNGQGKNNIVLANVGTNNTLGFHLFSSTGIHTLEAPNVLEIGKWTHLVATIDKSGIGKLYKDGQLIQSKQLTLPDNINRTLNYIGKSNWASDGYFEGQITEVRVWNIPRSQEEIQKQINTRLVGNESGLVIYLPLNEGLGNVATDKTGKGNDDAINGAIWKQEKLPIQGLTSDKIGSNVITGGNTPTQNGIADSNTNFYLVDTNNPINGNGELTGWEIWAENNFPVQLIIYRKEADVWLVVGKSEIKNPVVGLNQFLLATAIQVNQGEFVGIYHPQAGSVSFFKDNNSAWAIGNLSGKILFTVSGATPTAFSNSTNRIYSLSVKGNLVSSPSQLLKQGPAGSTVKGTTFDIQPKNELLKSRIKSVRISAGWGLDRIQVEYENLATIPTETYFSLEAGGKGGNLAEFHLEADDYITEIIGSWGAGAPGYPKQEIVTLQFKTKKGIISPEYGGGNANKQVESFSLIAPQNQEIIGFFGEYGNTLYSLGIYVKPVSIKSQTEIAPQTSGVLPTSEEKITPDGEILPNSEEQKTPASEILPNSEEQKTPASEILPNSEEQITSAGEILPTSEEQKTQPLTTMTRKKRLIICCDGTWNELASSYPTNVVKFARLVKYMASNDTPQVVLYLSGAGSGEVDLIEKIGGGAFGWGVDKIIQDAYRFLCINYHADLEDEIYLVGFSRGAYIARCLAGMIYNCGLLSRSKIRKIPKAYELYRSSKISPNSPEAQQFRQENAKQETKNISSETAQYLDYRVPIKFLGCWDSVGALGVPDMIPWFPIAKLWNKKYEFFDATLSPIVENAFHAVATDEKRASFPSTAMDKSDKNPNQIVEEVWFAGEHGCIGGGTESYRGLSDYTLKWMIEKAQKLGLEFDEPEKHGEEFQIKPDPKAPFDNSVTGFYALGGEKWRPVDDEIIKVHHSLIKRRKLCPDYRPENLAPFLEKQGL